MSDDLQFFTPTGRPQKVTPALQQALDKWRNAGLVPLKLKDNESQYFYTARLNEAFINRQRGYYGQQKVSDVGYDKRVNADDSSMRTVSSSRNRTPSAWEKSQTTLKGNTPRKTMGVLLGIASSAGAMSKRNR